MLIKCIFSMVRFRVRINYLWVWNQSFGDCSPQRFATTGVLQWLESLILQSSWIPSSIPRALNSRSQSAEEFIVFPVPFSRLACVLWISWHTKCCVSFSSIPSSQPSTFCSSSCYLGSCEAFLQPMASSSSKGFGAGTTIMFWQKLIWLWKAKGWKVI